MFDRGSREDLTGVRRGEWRALQLVAGTSSRLVPVDICTVDNNRKAIEVSADKDAIENSPSLGGGADITPEYEAKIRGYYRL